MFFKLIKLVVIWWCFNRLETKVGHFICGFVFKEECLPSNPFNEIFNGIL